MNVTESCAWIAYELTVALVTFAKTVRWFRSPFGTTRAGLESWVGLLLLAFSGAIGVRQWLGSTFLAALIAFGLASAMIVGAAANAAYDAGLRDGQDTSGQPPGVPPAGTEDGGRPEGEAGASARRNRQGPR
jgi:hypothetical protein